MPLHPNLAQSLRGRRAINLPSNRPQESLAYPFHFGRVQHPTNRPGGNRSLATNLTENIPVTPLRQTPNVGRGVTRHQTRDPITPSSSSLGIHPVYQPSLAQTEHTDSANPALPHLELPQTIGNYTPISGQGLMTGGNETSSYTQRTPYSSAPPSIVIESHDQQQVLLPGPSLSPSGRIQLSPSVLEPLNQYQFAIGQQRNTTQDQLLPELQLLSLVGWDARVIARVDKSVRNSWIYRDALPRLLKRPDWEKFICPWPPGHATFTGAGPDPEGGECIQLTFRNRDDHVVGFPLSVLGREQLHMTEIWGVDVVLCQDYFYALTSQQNTPMGVERQMEGMRYSNAGYQLQPSDVEGQSQNGINPMENLAYNYLSPVFPMSSNQMEGVQMHQQHLAQSYPYTMSSTSQGSSAALVSSTTSPDGPLPMAGAMPLNAETHPNMQWQQPDKPGS
ncbi:hypothetical protein F4801DRAFT_428728 [Xylaria longipes]|nr:hypothetical protein F4801DRAFT_428728 [Xylaria longipes]